VLAQEQTLQLDLEQILLLSLDLTQLDQELILQLQDLEQTPLRLDQELIHQRLEVIILHQEVSLHLDQALLLEVDLHLEVAQEEEEVKIKI